MNPLRLVLLALWRATHHSVCGNVLSESEDVVVRLRKVQVLVDGKEYSLSIIVVLPHPTYLIIVYY